MANDSMIAPHGIDQINRHFGNPDLNNDFLLDKDFVKEKLVAKSLPFPMRLSWNLSRSANRLLAHELIIDHIIDALTEIMNYKGYEWLLSNNYDLYGGCFNFRKKTGGNGLSTHAWGIAIDICPHLGQYGAPPLMPQFIVDAFVNRGFNWGGNWKNPDGMHFQACTGY